MRVAFLLAAALVVTSCATDRDNAARTARSQSRYSHELHNRFYEAWQQPTAVGAPHGKVSVPVEVTIDERGRVKRFNVMRRSG